jgi:hypothetical protein
MLADLRYDIFLYAHLERSRRVHPTAKGWIYTQAQLRCCLSRLPFLPPLYFLTRPLARREISRLPVLLCIQNLSNC